MGIFSLLQEEHDQIREMLAVTASDERKGEAFEQLRARIESHMGGEEEHVYPEIRAAGMKDEILQALEEHHIVKVVLGELEDMSDREESWMPKFHLFAELVEHHIHAEDRRVFPDARQRIGRERREELEAEYRQFRVSSATAGASSPSSESPFYHEV